MERGTVLVTGAAGFVGGHLMERLTASGAQPIGWSRRDVDLVDRDTVRARIVHLRPSAIYHCAGAPHVAESWRDTTRPLRSNALATHYLLDAVRRAGVPCRVLVTGSAAVYRAAPDPIGEDGAIEPSSPYAVSKLAQEQIAMRAIAEDGIEVVVTRPFNHTGPRQSPSFAAPTLARQLALIEAGRREPVIHAGNLDARRDLTDVRDTVRAYELLMARGRVGVPYNVCSGTAYAIREILDGLRARVRVPVQVEVDPARLRPNDTPVLVGSPARLQADTGWTPEIPFDRMLDDLLGYWRAEVARA
ncbi:MAG: GDP-mannose 4,6-dehydratase [Vicinamibacterales bacterium]